MKMLWVLGNSKGMCWEKGQIRAGLARFVEELRGKAIDVQVGITTTHAGGAQGEKVAELGAIQSTPHPPIADAEQCRHGIDASGAIDEDDFSPLRKQIEAAVACTKNPGQFEHLKDWTADEIRCAIFGENASNDACQKAGKSPDEFQTEQLFPCGNEFGRTCGRQELRQVYRDIPKVIRFSDERYENSAGDIDVEKLKSDLVCASLVGTRGDNREQGLRAAVRAVSPPMTGGTPEEPSDESAPNHGLIRKDAKTMVFFATDENDCSHADEKTDELDAYGCGELNCYFATKPGEQNPLTSTSDLADELLSNLADTKDLVKVHPASVHVGSFHGGYRRYVGNVTKPCGDTDRRERIWKRIRLCNHSRASARSGSRYEDFALEFDYVYPRQPAGGGHLKGLMCSGFESGIETIFESRGPRPSRPACIRREELIGCETDGHCPGYEWRNPAESVCQPLGESDLRFCESGVQLRLSAREAEKPVEKLRSTGLCVPESIGEVGPKTACVVARHAYHWRPCPGAPEKAIMPEWNPELVSEPSGELAGLELLRATRSPQK